MTVVAQPELGAPRVGTMPALWIAFVAVAVLKLVLALIYGPLITPDTGGYVGYAEAIRASRDWMSDAGLSQGAVPVFAMRMIGYPAIIAAAMAVFGSSWPIAILIVQALVSFAAIYALYRLALELAFPPVVALIAVLVTMTSMPLTYDQTILTDSFYASFILLAIVALVSGAPAQRPLSWRQALAAGLLLALAFLLRDATQILILALVPLLVVRIWLHGRTQWRWSLVCCVLVLAPPLAAAEIYRDWNLYRTGQRFVTTVAQVTVLHGLAKIAPTEPSLFGGDTPLDRVGSRLFRGNPFSEVATANNELYAQGFKAPEIARMAYAHYFQSWRQHPETMFRLLRRNISERAAKLTVRPIGTICETIEYAYEAAQCFDYRDLYRAIPTGFAGFSWIAPIFFVAQSAELAAAIAIFALFIVGVPVVVLRKAADARARRDILPLIFASFWAVYVAWYLAHAIVHMEDRYMAPVLPLSLLGGLYVLIELQRMWAHRAQGRP